MAAAHLGFLVMREDGPLRDSYGTVILFKRHSDAEAAAIPNGRIYPVCRARVSRKKKEVQNGP